ncbi:Mechanosensitive ion channel [Halogranum amylolyticum]|uniref:Mechanosensitive ion channel n=1 Tax=Halogranum amylolyticum TaxID=660520 RepID=A0A1H8RT83_9EURY|nr:mechanosensitive ion channel domain-containing protein [Halogranum amylolyticum]SEO69394.1 Mechanosensitive ion channel [Halogranum amylolyticum]
MLVLQSGLVTQAFVDFVANIRTALPAVVSGLVFLLLAAVLVKVVLFVLKVALKQTLPGESPVYRQFVTTVVGVFLWFGVGLSFLSIVGLEDIAASLGTAAGFVALGVSYATSSMIADAVAGIYLLRDPDFMPGDTVETGDTTGVVQTIELRKTRLAVDGDTVVRGNAEIEKKWKKVETAGEDRPTEEAVTS